MADRQATLDAVRKQVEFYFSDSNYPKDKFLRSQAAQNDEGYVPISVIATFSRMKKITEDLELVKEAVKTATTLQVSPDGQSVKRLAALPEQDTSITRTIYAKGFPDETGYSIEDVESVFSKFGKILSTRIRKTKNDKKQKPSVFVEFSTPEEADAAVAAASQFGGKDLLVLKKSDYNEKKKQERKERLDEKKAKRKAEEGESADNNNNNEKKQKRDFKKDEEPRESRISGAIVKFEGVGADVTREIVRELFQTFGGIEYIDFQQNQPKGCIRMESSDVAKKVIEELTKEPKELGGKVPTVTIMGEEEEKKYWDSVHQSKQNFQKKRKTHQRRKRF